MITFLFVLFDKILVVFGICKFEYRGIINKVVRLNSVVMAMMTVLFTMVLLAFFGSLYVHVFILNKT